MQQQRHSRIILGLLALGLLAGAALTAGPAQAVDAVGPYYAEPAWDQQLAPATRFVVLTNWASQAVLDKETGLVWERSPQTTLAVWYIARRDCASKTVGNRKGWRLPSIHELTSLIDPSQADNIVHLPPGHPFLTVINHDYWSATGSEDDNPSVPNAWYAGFGNGFGAIAPKVNPAYVWCVRGGNNADRY